MSKKLENILKCIDTIIYQAFEHLKEMYKIINM